MIERIARLFGFGGRRRSGDDRATMRSSPEEAIDEARLDDLPYGVIVVDPTGTILAFNRAESDATGIPRARVLGRNFFRDVAPCTSVRAFEGRFQRFVADAAHEIEPFEFVFPFASGAQRVTILFARGSATAERISIMVMRAVGTA